MAVAPHHGGGGSFVGAAAAWRTVAATFFALLLVASHARLACAQLTTADLVKLAPGEANEALQRVCSIKELQFAMRGICDPGAATRFESAQVTRHRRSTTRTGTTSDTNATSTANATGATDATATGASRCCSVCISRREQGILLAVIAIRGTNYASSATCTNAGSTGKGTIGISDAIKSN